VDGRAGNGEPALFAERETIYLRDPLLSNLGSALREQNRGMPPWICSMASSLTALTGLYVAVWVLENFEHLAERTRRPGLLGWRPHGPRVASAVRANLQEFEIICYIACVATPLVRLLMEDSMCWEIDHKFFADQKKAQETRIEQERRAGLIDRLLNDANRQGEKTVEKTPIKEAAPAK
jgi:hypothetical protein